jgi:hypothetical protein
MKVIGFNRIAQARDKRNAEKKAEILQKALNFFEEYHLPTDVGLMHKEGFYNYFLRLYAETYKNDFPAYMTSLERVQMAKVNTRELTQFQASYEAIRTPFDVDTMAVPENVDYSIYVDGERELMFDALEYLNKAIENYTRQADKFTQRFAGSPYSIDFSPIEYKLQSMRESFTHGM